MHLIGNTALDTLSAALFIVPLTLIFSYFRSVKAKSAALYCLFALYLAALYSVTGLPTVTYCRFDPVFQLVPFAGMAGDISGSLLNILLFIPMGLLPPVIWQAFQDIRRTLILGASMTITVELLQIFTFRASDINDIITNLLGVALGFFAARHIKRSAFKTDPKDIFVLLFIVFAVMFFIRPPAF